MRRKTIVLTHDRFLPSSVQPLGAALTEGDSIATELPCFAPLLPERCSRDRLMKAAKYWVPGRARGCAQETAQLR